MGRPSRSKVPNEATRKVTLPLSKVELARVTIIEARKIIEDDEVGSKYDLYREIFLKGLVAMEIEAMEKKGDPFNA